MFKKITFILLGLNLLIPKPVIAIEPITCTIGGCCIAIVSYIWGHTDGTTAANIENTKKENERKTEKRKAKEAEALRQQESMKRLQLAKNDYEQCKINKRSSDLGAAGVDKACKRLEKKLQALQG